MDGIAWTDLNSDEQRATAVLGAGASAELCAPLALINLLRFGLVRDSRLTPAAERLRKAAVLQELRRRWSSRNRRAPETVVARSDPLQSGSGSGCR